MDDLDTREVLLQLFGLVGEDLGDWRLSYILAWRNGFDLFDRQKYGQPLTQEEVAARLNITQQRVQQLEGMALKHIAENYHEEMEWLSNHTPYSGYSLPFFPFEG